MAAPEVEMRDASYFNTRRNAVLKACGDIHMCSTTQYNSRKRKTSTVSSYFGVNENRPKRTCSKGTLLDYFPLKEDASHAKASSPICKNDNSSLIQRNDAKQEIGIDAIPPELLTHIFSYLHGSDFLRAITVKRIWRQVGSMSKELDISWCTKGQKQRLPPSIPDIFRSLHTLIIGECNTPSETLKKLLKNNSQTLTTLQLDNNSRINDEMVRATSCCTNLEVLNWRNSERIGGDTAEILLGCEKGITAYFTKPVAGCKKIRTLDLSGTQKLYIQGLKLIVKTCSGLTKLKVHGAGFIDPYIHISTLTSKALSVIAECKTLKSLDFGGLMLSKDMEESWKKLGSHLEVLDISSTEVGNGFESLIDNCPKLLKLNVSSCKLTEEQLQYIRQHCTSLRELITEGKNSENL